MRQVTTHKRVGDVEHAKTELRGQPHEFAQYQFMLDKLHAKRVARERRKEEAALLSELEAMTGHCAFTPVGDNRTVGYGVRDRNDVDGFLKETEALTKARARGESPPPGFYAKAVEAIADTLDEPCPVMRDGRVIGTMKVSELLHTPTALERIKKMLHNDDIRRDTVTPKATERPTHGGYQSPRAG
jgi:hypothetical protein